MPAPRYSWMHKHPRMSLLLVNGVLLAALSVIGEYGLRLAGFDYTRKPAHLVLEDTFQVNNRGLFTANPASAVHRRAGININHDGFRSPEFDTEPAARRTKMSVAIIGDSFAWGASAAPISRSFADQLRAEGYEVYNLGIPGTGPLEYRKAAEVYLPRLKPDVVIVALYLGNDILTEEYEPPPGRLRYYVIEGGGWVSPFDDSGHYIESPEAAYEYLHNKFGKTRRFLRETVIGTLVLRAARVAQTWINESTAAAPRAMVASAEGPAQVLKRYAHSYRELRKIEQITEGLGARYYTFVIPALGKGCLPSSDFALEVQRAALRELHPVYMDASDGHYNAVPDCHLNNSGHALAAQTLVRLLRSYQ